MEEESEPHTNFQKEEIIARDTLERYSGSPPDAFQPFLLLTNFPQYVHEFALSHNLKVNEGSMFKVAHCPESKITILDFKIGSPAAALVVDLCAHLPIKAALLLGMCGGLRRRYKVGDYFIPVASIRGEGTSDFYFPIEVPALANFLVQKVATNILDEEKATYHIGITHTTNKRFWEFNAAFIQRLKMSRAQSIEMECATLFTASYCHKLPLGALLLISDLPLETEGIKTKQSSQELFKLYTADHLDKGVKILKGVQQALLTQPKGVFRGDRKRFEQEFTE